VTSSPGSWISATYDVRAPAGEIDSVARALATEQSVEMPLGAITDRRVLDEVVGRVEAITELDPGRYAVTLGLASETVGQLRPPGEPCAGALTAQLVNMLFGNASLLDDVRLVGVELPPDLLAQWPGPGHGIAGLRRLCGAGRRALTCAALKPQGMTATQLAELCGRFARSGIDVIKDDHGLADQAAAPFAARVAACRRAVSEAARHRDHTAQYAPSLVGSPATLAQQARIAREEGVQVVLVAPALIGLPAFAELVAQHLHGMAVIAHPAYSGAARVDPPLLLGRLFRLLGADATIFPNVGGRFAYSAARCRAIAEAARAPWAHVAGCVPVPAGGMTIDRVDELLDGYGDAVMLLIGGALLAAGEGLEAAAERFAARVADRGD
jgi:ribulose-bisphosphate carboxylase large chain